MAPSSSDGIHNPCQCTISGASELLTTSIVIGLPSGQRIRGPGTRPLYATVRIIFLGAISSLKGAISSRTSAGVWAHNFVFAAVPSSAKLAPIRKPRRSNGMYALLKALGTARPMMRPIEPSSENTLHNQMIGIGRCPNSDPKINLPVRGHIQIDRWEKLLRLIMQRRHTRDRSVGSVVLQAARNVFVEVVAEFRTGRKPQALWNARPMK